MKIIETIQTSVFGPFFRVWRSRLKSITWLLSGRPMPMPPHKKTGRVASVADILAISIFVETGTYRGDTSDYLRKRVNKVITIEVDKRLAMLAQRRFRNQNVQVVVGDSGELIHQVLSDVGNESVLYWLDGHYSAGVTGGKQVELPIQKELISVLPTLNDASLIMIDDVREFDGLKYPSVKDIESLVKQIRSDFSCEIKDDMLYVGALSTVNKVLQQL